MKAATRWACVGAVAFWTLGCAGGPPAPAGAPAPDTVARQALVPLGYGTLRQDAFTVALRSGRLQTKVTALEEWVIRLAAPDTYRRLRDLVETYSTQAAALAARAGAREPPLLFLVSFFTFAPQAEYVPTDIQIISQGRLYRPLEIIPLTPGWGSQLLRQEETQSALYLFDHGIDLNIPFTVQYGSVRAEAWEDIITTLEGERARALSRAQKP